MFDQFITRPFHLALHREGPFADERRRFLEHLHQEGRAFLTLKHATSLLLSMAQLLPLGQGSVSMADVEVASEQWLVTPPRDFVSSESRQHAKSKFIHNAKSWLSFLGRLKQDHQPAPFQMELDSFVQFQLRDRALAPTTVRLREWCVRSFLQWLQQGGRSLQTLAGDDISLYLRSANPGHWKRSTIGLIVSALRTFLRFAETNKWCASGLAATVDGPRIYSHERLPRGPRWEDVARLVAEPANPSPSDIRDRAILLLHAVYAFRNSEVISLRLSDIDWQQETICVSRSKQQRRQCYPLVPEVGDAIIHYLRQVRPKHICPQLFLSLLPPYRPMTTTGLSTMVRIRQRDLGLVLPRYGPHSLRHACATRLLAEGFSLKEIGDHLGHTSTDATQIYAKVDMPALRQVATMDLASLVDYAARLEADAASGDSGTGGQR